jgi:hypothetical protein
MFMLVVAVDGGKDGFPTFPAIAVLSGSVATVFG